MWKYKSFNYPEEIIDFCNKNNILPHNCKIIYNNNWNIFYFEQEIQEVEYNSYFDMIF